jgi:hypothetical protein
MQPLAAHRFLSLLSLPDAVDAQMLADPIAQNAGLDVHTLRLKLRRVPPCILMLCPQDAALAAVDTILNAGGDAFAPAITDMEALGPTIKIKDLALTVEGLEITPWRGMPCTIAPDELQIVIRAKLSEDTKLNSIVSNRFDSPLAPPMVGAIGYGVGGFGYGGGYGYAIRQHAEAMREHFSTMDRRIVTSHKLDVHLTDGRVFQVDGDKFGFRILGDQRGQSDHVNIDRMCEFFVHLNKDVVVDPYFSYFKPPDGYKRMKIPMAIVNKDDPAFAFYSRWAALMYRHVMGG